MVFGSIERAAKVVCREMRVLDDRMGGLVMILRTLRGPLLLFELFSVRGGAIRQSYSCGGTYPSSCFCFFDSSFFTSLILLISFWE
jgi:hypothetical protein